MKKIRPELLKIYSKLKFSTDALSALRPITEMRDSLS